MSNPRYPVGYKAKRNVPFGETLTILEHLRPYREPRYKVKSEYHPEQGYGTSINTYSESTLVFLLEKVMPDIKIDLVVVGSGDRSVGIMPSTEYVSVVFKDQDPSTFDKAEMTQYLKDFFKEVMENCDTAVLTEKEYEDSIQRLAKLTNFER